MPPALASVERLISDLKSGGRPDRIITSGRCLVQRIAGTRGKLAAVRLSRTDCEGGCARL